MVGCIVDGSPLSCYQQHSGTSMPWSGCHPHNHRWMASAWQELFRRLECPGAARELFATAMVRRTMALRPASGRSMRPSRSSLFGRPRRQFEHGHASNAFSIWLRLVAVVNCGGANRAAHLWEGAQIINDYDPSLKVSYFEAGCGAKFNERVDDLSSISFFKEYCFSVQGAFPTKRWRC